MWLRIFVSFRSWKYCTFIIILYNTLYCMLYYYILGETIGETKRAAGCVAKKYAFWIDRSRLSLLSSLSLNTLLDFCKQANDLVLSCKCSFSLNTFLCLKWVPRRRTSPVCDFLSEESYCSISLSLFNINLSLRRTKHYWKWLHTIVFT